MTKKKLNLSHIMDASRRTDFKRMLIIKTVHKLYEEGHLTETSTYKEKREIANKLDWSIGRLNEGINMYFDFKKKEKYIREQINEEAKKLEEKENVTQSSEVSPS